MSGDKAAAELESWMQDLEGRQSIASRTARKKKKEEKKHAPQTPNMHNIQYSQHVPQTCQVQKRTPHDVFVVLLPVGVDSFMAIWLDFNFVVEPGDVPLDPQNVKLLVEGQKQPRIELFVYMLQFMKAFRFSRLSKNNHLSRSCDLHERSWLRRAWAWLEPPISAEVRLNQPCATCE